MFGLNLGITVLSLSIEIYRENRLLGLLPRSTSMVHPGEEIYKESLRDEKGKMHPPPKRTANDLLLHMADEANTIIKAKT